MKEEEIDRELDQALKRAPAFRLRADFKESVISIIKKKEQKNQRRIYLLIAFGVLFMIGAGIVSVSLLGDLKAFSVYNDIIPIAVLAGILVAIIQYLDKRLVKDRFFKQAV